MGQTCLVTNQPSDDTLADIRESCLDVSDGLQPCAFYKKDELNVMFRKLFPTHEQLTKKEMYAYIASKAGKLT